jgi:4-amino-4-deoxy-L-arabinose transferase-like glycosyltransferase
VANLIKVQRAKWRKEKLLFLFIIPLFLYIFLLPVMPLIEPDEARYSDVASLMNRTGDYITPHLNHVIYLEKPPLAYWATALFFKIFGENEFSARLFAALCAWGCILLVYRMGTFFHDEKTGLYSAGVLSTFLYHSILGKINVLDMPLTFFVCLATWAAYRYFIGECQRKGWLYLLYVGSAFAFLTKGLIGVIFPFAIAILWLSISKRWGDILRLFSPVGLILFLLISCPWIILVEKANKDFLWFFFIREHFLRYATTLHARDHTVLYYIPIVLLGTLPWSAFLLKALKEGVGKRMPLFKGAEKKFLWAWTLFILIFFSVSSSKLIPYVAPVFLPVAVFMGHLFRSYEDRTITLGKGRTQKYLYDLPIFLQSFMFISLISLLLFGKVSKLSKYMANSHIEKWWWLLILPTVIQIMMVFLPALIKKRWGRGWFLTIAVLSTLFLISMHFPLAYLLTPYRSAYPVSKAIHALLPPNQELYQVGISLYGIDFYNKIRTPQVGHFGELQYGVDQLPLEERSHYFLFYDEFIKRCKEKDGLYCVMRGKENVEELEKRIPTVEVLWNNGQFCLMRLGSAPHQPTHLMEIRKDFLIMGHDRVRH